MQREHTHRPVSEIEHLMQTHGDPPPQDTDHRDAVVAYVEALPPDQREVLEAYFFQGASLRAIARMQGTNHVNVWRQVNAAIEALRENLTNDPTIQRRYHL